MNVKLLLSSCMFFLKNSYTSTWKSCPNVKNSVPIFSCVTTDLSKDSLKFFPLVVGTPLLPDIAFNVNKNENIFAISGSILLLKRSLHLSHSSLHMSLLFPSDSLIA